VQQGKKMKRNGFGDRLKELLKQKQLTQAQVAQSVGTSVPSVNRWTKGGEIEYDNLRTLADFLEVNWVWLRYGDEAIQSLQQTLPDNDAVTDMRREYLNQILDNEARMKSALEMAQIINWEWNVLTGALSLSENANDVFGCDARLAETQLLPFAEKKLEDLLTLFKDSHPYRWDFSLSTGADTKWFSSTAKLQFDSLQRPVKLIGVTADITARKQAERALERSDYMMRKIIDLIPVGLWAADEQGTICLANPEVKRIWGGAKYVSLDHYGEYKGWWEKTGEEVGSEGWTLARAVSHGESSQPEVVNIEAFDGVHRTITMYATPLYDTNNQIIGAIEVNQDITEAKNTERALRSQLEQWQAVFIQDQFDVIKLDHQHHIEQVSHTLKQHISEPIDGRSLESVFDANTVSTIQTAWENTPSGTVSACLITARLNYETTAADWSLLHDKRSERTSMTLLFRMKPNASH
jgi:PAS domain S-box-containing protein